MLHPTSQQRITCLQGIKNYPTTSVTTSHAPSPRTQLSPQPSSTRTLIQRPVQHTQTPPKNDLQALHELLERHCPPTSLWRSIINITSSPELPPLSEEASKLEKNLTKSSLNDLLSEIRDGFPKDTLSTSERYELTNGIPKAREAIKKVPDNASVKALLNPIKTFLRKFLARAASFRARTMAIRAEKERKRKAQQDIQALWQAYKKLTLTEAQTTLLNGLRKDKAIILIGQLEVLLMPKLDLQSTQWQELKADVKKAQAALRQLADTDDGHACVKAVKEFLDKYRTRLALLPQLQTAEASSTQEVQGEQEVPPIPERPVKYEVPMLWQIYQVRSSEDTRLTEAEKRFISRMDQTEAICFIDLLCLWLFLKFGPTSSIGVQVEAETYGIKHILENHCNSRTSGEEYYNWLEKFMNAFSEQIAQLPQLKDK